MNEFVDFVPWWLDGRDPVRSGRVVLIDRQPYPAQPASTNSTDDRVINNMYALARPSTARAGSNIRVVPQMHTMTCENKSKLSSARHTS
jgi:hypothetical protein